MKMADNKRVAKKAKDEKRNIKNCKPTEVEILRGSTHQNIIRIYNFCVHDRFIYMPIEICDMNLEEYIKGFDYEIEKRLDILKQIGCGLKYLHCLSSEIIHRDLQPRNVLIKLDCTNLTVKLSDFGISRVLMKDDDEKELKTEPRGSLYCRPPEVIQKTGVITMAVDIYAFGALIQTLITKDKKKIHPFGNMKNTEIFKDNVVKGNRINFLATENERTDFLILADLAVSDATNKEYEKRPDIRTVTKHPLFWTTRKKELLLKGINNDYFKICSGTQAQKCANSKTENADKGEGEKQRTMEFINDFNAKFVERFKEKQDGSVHWGEASELQYILERNNNQKKKPDYEYDTKYSTLVNFIRNISEHYREHTKRFENDTRVIDMLGTNTTDFIEHVLSKYPYLIHDIFTCYRKALLRGECKDDDYHAYFGYFAKSKSFEFLKASLDRNDARIQNTGHAGGATYASGYSRNSTTVEDILIEDESGSPLSICSCSPLPRDGLDPLSNWDSDPAIEECGPDFVLSITDDYLSRDYTMETMIRYETFIKNKKDWKPFFSLEYLMRLPRALHSSKQSIAFLEGSIPYMDYDYFQSLECEMNCLKNLDITTKPTRSCKYGVIENRLFTVKPIKYEVIETSKCLNHEFHDDCVEEINFDLQQVRSAARHSHHWWLDYAKSNGERRMFSFILDNIEDLYKILEYGKDIMLYRSSEKFKNDILSKLYSV